MHMILLRCRPRDGGPLQIVRAKMTKSEQIINERQPKSQDEESAMISFMLRWVVSGQPGRTCLLVASIDLPRRQRWDDDSKRQLAS